MCGGEKEGQAEEIRTFRTVSYPHAHLSEEPLEPLSYSFLHINKDFPNAFLQLELLGLARC